MRSEIKICGIRSLSIARLCASLPVRYIGLVFFAKSPRYINLEMAATISRDCPESLKRVGLVVNPTPYDIERIVKSVPLDLLQLHGQESPQECANIYRNFGLRTIKALGVSTTEDLKRAQDYQPYVERLLFDAKPPKGSKNPGGNARRFNWEILSKVDFGIPYLLAGGINAANARKALENTTASGLDVSSGVEIQKGVKCPTMIKGFLAAV